MRIAQDTRALLCCLDMSGDHAALARLGRLPGLEWTGIVRQAARRGVAPLLYERLRTLSSGIAIPDAVLQTLRRRYLRSAAKNALVCRQLSALIRTLHEDHIQVALLKGAHLAKLVYGNIALRPMRDLDLLVRKADLAKAGEKLLQAGYKPHPYNAWYQENDHYHLTYLPRAEGVEVELHWDIHRWATSANGHAEGLWRRAEPLCIDGIGAFGLSAEDLLLHLCLHTCSQHTLSQGLIGLCDICETIKYGGGELQWRQVQRRANRWAASRPVYLTLYLARELLRAPVPDESMRALEPNDLDGQVTTRATELVLASTIGIPVGLPRLRSAKRLRDKAVALLRGAFPSPEAVPATHAVRRNSPWLYPCYVARLGYLLRTYGVPLWRMLRGDEALRALLDNTNALRDWLRST